MLFIDAQTALDYIKNHHLISKTPIVSLCATIPQHELTIQLKILYGLSLGGTVAIDLASRNSSVSLQIFDMQSIAHNLIPWMQIYAVILENTLPSLWKLVKDRFPLLLPFLLLCNDKWDSTAKIRSMAMPILMLSGTRDIVVPTALMKSLWEKIDGVNKQSMFVEVDGGRHGKSCKALCFFLELNGWIDNTGCKKMSLKALDQFFLELGLRDDGPTDSL